MDALLFWDIDGTLLTTARAGIFAWEEAVGDVVGRPVSLQDMHTAGLTDVEIARRILIGIGEELRGEVVNRLLRRYELLLPARLPLRVGHALPGVRETLEYLASQPGTRSLLLTGNTAAAARAKLSHYGLAAFFDAGAFAEDGDDRPGIARRALEIARAQFGSIPPGGVFVIGDTPEDIVCGRSIGAKTVAVATGLYSRQELEQHHPWWAVDRLPPPHEFVARISPETSRTSLSSSEGSFGRP